ncbi:hypothetical protein AVEN_255010-1 [Araneus ventricosus]|uniref:Uncharacterized protein n=1 Tax=Araneus ventricosus TaxID=182803 RepID=A0A4Y2TVD1_ARAVE|nr:hypothetical protein AVEN_255010-1 [Araneus ventricosus]
MDYPVVLLRDPSTLPQETQAQTVLWETLDGSVGQRDGAGTAMGLPGNFAQNSVVGDTRRFAGQRWSRKYMWITPVVLEGSPSTLASGKLQDQNSVVGDTRRFAGQRWSRNSYGITR